MTAGKSHAYFTPKDYLEIEKISPIKHEYIQGQILAMAGASKAHVIITGNLSAQLINHLRGSGCLAFATDMKVRLPSLNIFYYPDFAITCDQLDRVSQEDFILHPRVIIEVLSDDPAAFDRGDKFADYQTIPELEEYLLIEQKQVLIEQYQRQSNNLWIPHIYQAGDLITINCINFSCPIEILYQNLEILS